MEDKTENCKIISKACELNLAYHCNLNCTSCSHISNKMEPFFLDKNQISNDLKILLQAYSPQTIRLLGGEPLLHPDFLDIIKGIRQLNFEGKISVITNGMLLNRMSDEFWANLDEVHISRYPQVKLKDEDIQNYTNKANDYGVELIIKYFNYFRISYSEIGSTDKELVNRIYSSCQITHIWECHNVDQGYFYKCPQSIFLPKIIQSLRPEQDRIKISPENDFKDTLLRFLRSSLPLNACTYCLGSAGKLISHNIHGKTLKTHNYESCVDYQFLEQLERTPTMDNGCVSDG